MSEKDDNFKEVIDVTAFKGMESKATELKNLLNKIKNGKWKVLCEV